MATSGLPIEDLTTEQVVPAAPTTAAARRTAGRASPTSTTLLCKNLKSRGYNFAEANAYWELEGKPDRMDADGNGIPCQTVYPLSQIHIIYPGAEQPPPVQPAPAATTEAAPSQVYYQNCDAVRAAGKDPLYTGDPGYDSHLDRDGDGIACE